MKKLLSLAVGTALVLSLSFSAVYAQGARRINNDFKSERIELTEEQKAEMLANCKERLAQQLADGKITQEQYDEAIEKLENGEMPKMGFGKGEKPEMTEEQKAEMLANCKERLAQQLADGKITQELYDEAIEKLENGEMPKMGFGKGEKPEMTEEQKAEMLANCKERLAQQLADGKITQEQYDEAIEKSENGEMPKMNFGKGRGNGNMKAHKASAK